MGISSMPLQRLSFTPAFDRPILPLVMVTILLSPLQTTSPSGLKQYQWP